MRLRLSQLSTKLKLKLKLSLAIGNQGKEESIKTLQHILTNGYSVISVVKPISDIPFMREQS